MLRQSLKVFVNSLDSSLYKQAAIEILSSSKFHRRLRSELVMMPIPKPLTDDATKVDKSYLKSQRHNIEAAIDRVSYKTFMRPFYLQIEYFVLWNSFPLIKQIVV